MSKSGSSNGTERDRGPAVVTGILHRGTAPIALPPTLTEADDAALVAAASDGHNQAFEALVRRHWSQTLGVALRLTRVREDAEDIAQQSFQKVFLHLQQFEGRSSFSTWLTRIVVNEALMWRREKRPSPEVPIEKPSTNDGTALPLDLPDPRPSPEDSCIQRERERLLYAAMNELTPALRKAIELRGLDELSNLETARVMGLSVGAVKSRVLRGRGTLREMLKGYVESPWTPREKQAMVHKEDKGHEIAKSSSQSRRCGTDRVSDGHHD